MDTRRPHILTVFAPVLVLFGVLAVVFGAAGILVTKAFSGFHGAGNPSPEMQAESARSVRLDYAKGIVIAAGGLTMTGLGVWGFAKGRTQNASAHHRYDAPAKEEGMQD